MALRILHPGLVAGQVYILTLPWGRLFRDNLAEAGRLINPGFSFLFLSNFL